MRRRSRRDRSPLPMDPRRKRRLAAGLLSGALGVALLTNGAGTYARWSDAQSVGTGSVSAGSVNLTLDGASTLQLLSRQPAGSRTYASTQTCTVPSGYIQCRVVTSTLPQERLIPGDTVRIRQSATLAAVGSTLRGEVEIDARGVVASGTSSVSGAAVTSTTVTTPAGSTSTLTGNRGTFTVNVGAGTGIGTYAVVSDVLIPAANGAARWGTQLRAQTLDLGELSVSFYQTR